MRTDIPKDRKTTDEIIHMISKHVAMILAFVSVFFFFFKILFF
jgi:hypothetical protein